MKNEGRVPFSALGVVMAIGIVYGDIGTSPLYVMKAAIGALPATAMARPDYILGIVSCVIWTLTLQTTVKYVLTTLKADNKGEGGILSLFALIRQKYRWAYIFAAIGAATLLADGIITPSITVISAIEGLNTLMPQVPVIPVTLAIIIVLFLVQPLGTGSLGKYFGSVMVAWFLMLGILGLYQFFHFPEVIAAFNPWYAVNFLIHAPGTLFILGAVFLCTTGAEALYSDLGHCGLKNIRVSWIFVKSMLVLNYIGQAAWIINHPDLVTNNINPFFAIMPLWFGYIGVGMATVAAIIASQALISGSFTIVSEAVSLNIWPNVKIKYPTDIKGQMFIPSVNYILMFLCLTMVVGFQSSSNLEAAYGLAITLSMLMTTMLLFLYFLHTNKPLWFAIPLTTFFVTVESSFLVANLQKFVHGGYASLLIAGLLFAIMIFWYKGRRIKNRLTRYENIDRIIEDIKAVSEDKSIPKFATHLVYTTRAKNKNSLESKIIYSLLHKQPKRADTYWFVYLYKTDDPYEFSYSTSILCPHKIFRIDIRAGFKLGIHVEKYLHLIAKDLESKRKVNLSSRYPSLKERNYEGDFKFVVVERSFKDVQLNTWKQIVLNMYDFIKRFATSDSRILDLDPSVVTVETVPHVLAEYSDDKLVSSLPKLKKTTN